MYLAIIVLPLLGSIVSGLFGRKIGTTGAQIITVVCVGLTTVLSILSFYEVGLNNIPVSIQLFSWINSESLNVLWAFNFDSLTVSMLIPVLIVSCLVHLYSIGYMSHDPHNQRFFSYLSLFTFMMVILVTANSFLLMFVGWEGVGICSYLLVSFWFTRIAANQSSISALLTNRVGDCFLTIGMFGLIWAFGNLDYATVFSLAPYINENIITIIGICLLIGAMAKSSQVGLHVWLPQAMEGPTPVSALIHAATMVTAGVYLLMRSSPLIEFSSTVLILCLWIGAITTLFSSLVGLFQQDIKKVIAYSTMSQLGMMVIAVGLSSYNIALFHLINHAFYKALLFLGAGSVIHAVSDNQDFRKYGGLINFLPLTYSVMLIASLSLVAFPFMTGFYSKDLILESSYGQFTFSSIVVYFIAVIGAMFTTLYSSKILYLTFLSNPMGSKSDYNNVHESDIYMTIPLIILAIFSIFFGFVSKDIFIGMGSNFYGDNALFFHPSHEIFLDTEFGVISLFKHLPFLLTISLTMLSIFISEFYPKILIYFKFTRLGYNIFSFFNQRFYVELFYNRYITDVVLKLGGQTTKVLDKGSIELLGPFGLEKGLTYLSRNISGLDTGIITNYALYILIGFMYFMLIPHITISSPFVVISFSLFSLLSFNSSSSFYKNNLDKFAKQKEIIEINTFNNPPKPHKFANTSAKHSSLLIGSFLISLIFSFIPKYFVFLFENLSHEHKFLFLLLITFIAVSMIDLFKKSYYNISLSERLALLLTKALIIFLIGKLIWYLYGCGYISLIGLEISPIILLSSSGLNIADLLNPSPSEAPTSTATGTSGSSGGPSGSSGGPSGSSGGPSGSSGGPSGSSGGPSGSSGGEENNTSNDLTRGILPSHITTQELQDFYDKVRYERRQAILRDDPNAYTKKPLGQWRKPVDPSWIDMGYPHNFNNADKEIMDAFYKYKDIKFNSGRVKVNQNMLNIVDGWIKSRR